MSTASPLRLASLLVVFLTAAFVWSTTAQAQTQHSLTGNARFQIGNGLPIPIGFTPAPDGAVLATPSAIVTQGPGPDPRSMKIAPGALVKVAAPINLPVFPSNSNVFQVNTNIGLQWPNGAVVSPPGNTGVTFAAGNRTGAPVVAFCPGDVVTPSGNPNCAEPSLGSINGLMRYTATAAQFGGPVRGSVTGTADVALRGNAGAPCSGPNCVIIMALASPQPTGAQGAAFGLVISTTGAGPNPGAYTGTVTANGAVTNIGNVLGPGAPNPATSYGGPWTTGMLTISVTENVGATSEVFVLSGSDARVNGVGSISLVSGSVSDRTLSGPNANRGWVNLVVGPQIEGAPTMGMPGIAAFLGLMGLTGAYALRRRVRA